MIYEVCSMGIEAGKTDEAVQWLKRFAGFLKRKLGLEMQVLRNMTPDQGQSNRLVTLMTFESMAAWGDYIQRGQKDAEWQAFVREGWIDKKIVTHNSFSRRLYEVK